MICIIKKSHVWLKFWTDNRPILSGNPGLPVVILLCKSYTPNDTFRFELNCMQATLSIDMHDLH